MAGIPENDNRDITNLTPICEGFRSAFEVLLTLNPVHEERNIDGYMILNVLRVGEISGLVTFHVKMLKRTTMDKLMGIISKQLNTPLEFLSFCFRHQLIRKVDTIESLRLKDNDNIIVCLKGQERKRTIWVTVVGDCFKKMDFRVKPITKMGELVKAWYHMKTGLRHQDFTRNTQLRENDTQKSTFIPLSSLNFSFNGRQLMPDDTVGKLRMQDYDLIVVSKIEFSDSK